MQLKAQGRRTRLVACALSVALFVLVSAQVIFAQTPGENPRRNAFTAGGGISSGNGAANAPARVHEPYVSPAPPARPGAAAKGAAVDAPVGVATATKMKATSSGGNAPIPLLPPDDPDSLERPPTSPTGAIWTVVSSLSIVLGLFFVVVFMSRRGAPGGPAALPQEAFEVLGRSPLAGRQQAQVVRFGDKLILLAVSATSVEALAEVTSPEEVERIAGACQQRRDNSVTSSFQQVLQQFTRESAPPGFVGSERNESRTQPEEAVSEFEKLA